MQKVVFPKLREEQIIEKEAEFWLHCEILSQNVSDLVLHLDFWSYVINFSFLFFFEEKNEMCFMFVMQINKLSVRMNNLLKCAY